MELNKKTVDDINVKGKRVLCRCDFNVPIISGKITDENRLVAALPTIKKLIADGGKVILCSHLGKVKTEEDKLTKTLAPVAVRLSELLGQEVKFVADPEVVGKNVRAAVAAMKDGDVILLENTRFRAEEISLAALLTKQVEAEPDVETNDEPEEEIVAEQGTETEASEEIIAKPETESEEEMATDESETATESTGDTEETNPETDETQEEESSQDVTTEDEAAGEKEEET